MNDKNETKMYNSAPLPFQGQKRNFLRKFREALLDFPEDATYVDLFGGSGLLSQTVKRVKPNAEVVFNDFDNYCRRIAAIPHTNAILNEIRGLGLVAPKGVRMSETQKDKIVELLEKAETKYEFVDWITLSSNFLFSGKYALSYKELVNSAWYYKLRKSNYDIPINYLKGVHIVRQDYKELYKRYCRNSNVIFLVDPPYLSTDVSSYSNGGYWNLKDYLNVIDVLDSSYFYFTSNKSQIVPLMQWVGTKSAVANPFSNAKKYSVTNGVTHNAKYEDLMYCFNKEKP